MNGSLPLKQSPSRSVERGDGVLGVGEPGRGAPVAGQLGLHRRHADPVLLLDLRWSALSESAYWLDPRSTTCRRTSRAACWRGRSPTWRRRSVVLVLGHVGEVVEAADQVDGVVELLLAHALALDVAQALGPAVLVGVELAGDVPQRAPREVVEVGRGSGRRPSSARPARPRDGNLAVSSVLPGVGVGAEVDRAVGDDLVRDLAGVGVEVVGDLAQRAQVVLDRLELAERDRRERRVLAVGGEHPRVVGVAGADERRALDVVDRAPGYALPWSTKRICRFVAVCVRSARFCLPQSSASCSLRSPGRSTTERAASSSRSAILAASCASGSTSAAASSLRGVGDAPVGAGDRDPDRLRRARAERDACSAAGRRRPCRTGRRRRRWAPTCRRPCRSRRAAGRGGPGPTSPASGRAGGGDERRVVVRLGRRAACRGP